MSAAEVSLRLVRQIFALFKLLRVPTIVVVKVDLEGPRILVRELYLPPVDGRRLSVSTAPSRDSVTQLVSQGRNVSLASLHLNAVSKKKQSQ